MCRSLADGGQRCAAHTGPAFNDADSNLARGCPEWMEAATAHASTRGGAAELRDKMGAAEGAGDFASYGAFHMALKQGQSLRDANREAHRLTVEAELATNAQHPDFQLTRTDMALLDEAGVQRSFYPDTLKVLNRLAPPRTPGAPGAGRAWQRINQLIDTPQAADYAPETVQRLRARRERQRVAPRVPADPGRVLVEAQVSDLENPMLDGSATANG